MNRQAKIHRAEVGHTYRYRTVECDECGGTGRTRGCFGGGPYPCDHCGGLGWHGAECAECGQDERLNDEGVCNRCVDASELPADAFNLKYAELRKGSGLWQ